MANDDIRGDLWELTIDQVTVGYASLTWSGPVTAEAVRNAATGQTPVAMLVSATGGELRVNPHGVPTATLNKLLNITSGEPPAIGSRLPTHEVALHNPLDADNTKDVCFRAMCFTAARTSDGQGAEAWDVVGMALYHADGAVEIGDPATVLGWA